jgi:hypothetical protein
MKEGSENGASLSEGALSWEHGGRAPLLGTLKDMLSKALEMGICFHRGPILWGTWRNGPFLGPLREEKKMSLIGKFYEEFARQVKEGSLHRQLSPQGPLLGNLEGVHLLGLLRDR